MHRAMDRVQRWQQGYHEHQVFEQVHPKAFLQSPHTALPLQLMDQGSFEQRL